jgi:hypothetical protein
MHSFHPKAWRRDIERSRNLKSDKQGSSPPSTGLSCTSRSIASDGVDGEGGRPTQEEYTLLLVRDQRISGGEDSQVASNRTKPYSVRWYILVLYQLKLK